MSENYLDLIFVKVITRGVHDKDHSTSGYCIVHKNVTETTNMQTVKVFLKVQITVQRLKLLKKCLKLNLKWSFRSLGSARTFFHRIKYIFC